MTKYGYVKFGYYDLNLNANKRDIPHSLIHCLLFNSSFFLRISKWFLNCSLMPFKFLPYIKYRNNSSGISILGKYCFKVFKCICENLPRKTGKKEESFCAQLSFHPINKSKKIDKKDI